MVLSNIATQQSAPTENTKKQVDQFLDYMWTHPDATIQYRASDMILNVHSDALCLSIPQACSRAGGYFFLGSIPIDGNPIKLNGAIHINWTILRLHGGRDDSILSVIQAKRPPKLRHQRNSRQILQNCATDSR
jgi:hypothetical protein